MFGKNRSNHYVHYDYTGQMVYGRPVNYSINARPFSRNQPYPYQARPQNVEWYPYQQSSPYHYQQNNSFVQNYQPGYVQQQPQYSSQQFPPKDAQFLFQNPLHPQNEMTVKQNMYMNSYPLNPYPKQSTVVKQPGGIQSIMNSFKGQDGTVDINKMVNTAGQMVNAVSQVSSLVKGFGGMFKA